MSRAAKFIIVKRGRHCIGRPADYFFPTDWFEQAAIDEQRGRLVELIHDDYISSTILPI